MLYHHYGLQLIQLTLRRDGAFLVQYQRNGGQIDDQYLMINVQNQTCCCNYGTTIKDRTPSNDKKPVTAKLRLPSKPKKGSL